jgi:hypothetical protein
VSTCRGRTSSKAGNCFSLHATPRAYASAAAPRGAAEKQVDDHGDGWVTLTGMPRSTRAIVTYCLIIAVAGIAGCGGTVATVARVGEREISAPELDHWSSVFRSAYGRMGGDAEARERTLGFLILSRWLAGEATELGIEVSSGEVRKQLDLLRFDEVERRGYGGLARDPELRKLLLASGRMDASDRQWLMKLNMLATRIDGIRVAQARREVTEAQIATYYRRHRNRLLLPETRDIESVMTKHKAGAMKAKREIQSGKSFSSTVRRFNASPEGGLHLRLARGAGEPVFERVVFAANPNILLGPIKQQLYYIFEVLRITPAHDQTLAQARPSIRTLLASQVALPRLRRTIEAMWIARTSCSPALATGRCGVRRNAGVFPIPVVAVSRRRDRGRRHRQRLLDGAYGYAEHTA